ncbi:MAG: glycosyltransferase [Planctomycetota bacterium]
MKICIATSTFPSHPEDGGASAGFFVRDFALALAERGCAVHVLTQRTGLTRIEDPPSIRVTRFPWWTSLKRPSGLTVSDPRDIASITTLVTGGATQLLTLLARQRFDCALAMWAVPAGLWTLSARIALRLPYCVWALGSDIWDYGRRPVYRPLLRAILRGSLRNYADGFRLAEEVRKISGAPCAFLPSSRRLPVAQVAPSSPHAPTRFLCIGRWHPNKGIDVLLEAMAILLRENVEARLDVYGGGPSEGALREIIRTRGLPPSAVALHGYVGPADAAKAISACDCVIIPSRIDSIPVILSDAVSLGKIVIATRVGDMGDLVDRHRCGLTCPPEDPQALADAMRLLLRTDPQTFRAGVEAVASLFDIGRAADQFLSDLASMGLR